MEAGKSADGRLLALLGQLFEIAPAAVDAVLSRCADLIGAATGAEKVDAFLYDPASSSLVAVGTSHTELARLQRSLGLDRLPLANADPMAVVYETGEAYQHGHIDDDPRQPRGVIENLGVRSMLGLPLEVGGVRRGVISLASQRPNAFSPADLSLMRVVSVWVGGLVHRSELLEAHKTHASELARRAVAEELITVVAHDLRNMLSPVVSRVQVMLHRAQQAARADEVNDCERVLFSMSRITDLMTDLLDVARIEKGILSLTYAQVDVVELVRTTARALAPPDAEIRVRSYTDQLHAVLDRARFGQALANVLSNAIKHSPRGTPVAVEISPVTLQSGEAVKIVIADQGPGIAPELLPRVFERFVSGNASAGLGLGLYLTRAVVSAHGGTIALNSSPAQGTRCEITLPIRAASA